MADLTGLQERQQHLIRKALNGSCWLGAYGVAAPTTLTAGAASDPEPLPTGYEDSGYVTKDDGLAFSRNVETSDTTSWGVFEPTRSDLTSDVDTVKWVMQETKKLSLELYNNVDLSGVTPDVTTGEVSFTKGGAGGARYWSWMGICQDGSGADAIYIGRHHPRLKITAFGDQSWVDGTELRYDVTGTAFVDPVLEYSTRFFFGGPGWKAALLDMGFGSGS